MGHVVGHLRKMIVSLADIVKYQMPLDDQLIDLNNLIGSRIKISFLNEIRCIECGKLTNKSYAQGFCYQCFLTSPQTDECTLHPEKCKAHLGISRNAQWAEQNCLSPHIVYFAWSSHLKVGVTRLSQIPTRWIDQGASAAIKLALTPNRHIAGIIEIYLKKFYSDKTAWQQMLQQTNTISAKELTKEKQKAADLLPVNL
jgi:hypothetical protein